MQSSIDLVKVAEVDIGRNLSHLAAWLSGKRIFFKIIEQGGSQVIYVDKRIAIEVQSFIITMLEDEEIEAKVKSSAAQRTSKLLSWHAIHRPVHAPFVLGLIVLSLIVAFVTALGEGGPILRALLFADPFQVVDDTVQQRVQAVFYNLKELQWWRFFTPAIIHFSVLHIVFNMLWLWYLGVMVEMKQGRMAMIGLFLVTALVSNAAQYIETGPLFGGMSGVVYGLVGYCWLWDKINKPMFHLPDALMGFMVGWLVIGYMGIIDTLIGRMANTAHLLGLVTGLILAVSGLLYKVKAREVD